MSEGRTSITPRAFRTTGSKRFIPPFKCPRCGNYVKTWIHVEECGRGN